MGQEVLVFGGSAIKEILKCGRPTMENMLALKKETGCAVILCHPGEEFELAVPACDGYERIRRCVDYFKDRPLGILEGKQGWCDSDAHRVERLEACYSIVDSKIETEGDLIKYIKKQKKPEFFIKG